MSLVARSDEKAAVPSLILDSSLLFRWQAAYVFDQWLRAVLTTSRLHVPPPSLQSRKLEVLVTMSREPDPIVYYICEILKSTVVMLAESRSDNILLVEM